jgi:hypothetical protein
LIGRSLARAAAMAKADSSPVTARMFYNILGTPLSVWNCEGGRLLCLLDLAGRADENTPGEYMARAVETLEPHVMWQSGFLRTRAIAYRNCRPLNAEKALRDFEEFTSGESAIANVSALARAIRSTETTTQIHSKPAVDLAAFR